MGVKTKKMLFRSIKDRIWGRLHSWIPNLFSQGGKEILLKGVIQAMPTYFMCYFRTPEGQCQEFEKLMARYWWGSVESKQKIHWKAWKDISVSKSEGGLGFRKFSQYNQALLAKQAWRILRNPNSLISQVLQAKYFTNSGFLDSKEGSYPSLTWRGICWGKELLKKGLRKRIGNGQDTNAFNDPWLPRPPSFLPITKCVNDNLKVSELIQQPGMWNNGLIQQIYLSPDAQLISTIPLSPLDHTDSWMWHYNKNVNYSVRSGYNLALNADIKS
ncbi:putative mitochondrial protein AtMg00310 [Apium graveolens]|uniref:putative mitochondrial protein AtMg00310 n=1 Tax=Apium graveolens TaxID=4045 RepID=UPI003D79F815